MPRERSVELNREKTDGAISVTVGDAVVDTPEGSCIWPSMLNEGRKAPAFTLPAADGEKVSLEGLAGKWVVLYFYPKDHTPGCTTEAQEFRDAKAELDAADAIVLGVSKDTLESHGKFRDKHALNFPLLSDPEGKVIDKYGAWGEKNMYGKKRMGIIRTTVLIDPDGKIAKVFPNVRVKGHVAKVLEALRDG